MAHLREHGQIEVAGFRELVGTTRRFALPLLNYFDGKGLTPTGRRPSAGSSPARLTAAETPPEIDRTADRKGNGWGSWWPRGLQIRCGAVSAPGGFDSHTFPPEYKPAPGNRSIHAGTRGGRCPNRLLDWRRRH